ncbi:MAG: class sortase [Herbinix sp.]|jgi:sortase A|nr:class sortase [Herbinix sp.]
MKSKLMHILAYLYMPILFALLGYSLIYLVAAPGIHFLNTTLAVILTEEAPNHNYDLKTIYHAQAKQDKIPIREEIHQTGTDKACLSEVGNEITNVDDIVKIDKIEFPELGEHYAMVSCERIDLEVPIYWGDTQKILNAGVGHFMGSFLPGFGRSILLSAHNTTYFKNLEIIQVGDVVRYDTNYGEFQYLIDEVSVLNADDAESMLNNILNFREEKLIMYTCYPFGSFANKKEKRLFVFGEKLSGPRVEK